MVRIVTTTPLILLRHGESEWNDHNLFAGWADVDLTERGVAEAVSAGALLREHGELPDAAYTSLLRRSVRTCGAVLHEAGRGWVTIHRSWRLNERHYGALQGKNKAAVRAEYGEELFRLWRRSYEGLPPPLAEPDQRLIDSDPRYRLLGGAIPRAESLRDVGRRLLPYYCDAIGADIRAGRRTLVVGHSNSLRALIMHLERIPPTDIIDLNVPTGVPLRYDIDSSTLLPVAAGQYLDPLAAARGIAEVAAQGDRAAVH